MTHQFEVRIAHEMRDVAAASRKEIVNTQDVVPVLDQLLTQVRPEKTGASSHHNALVRMDHGTSAPSRGAGTRLPRH